jgi:hypothetical protein
MRRRPALITQAETFGWTSNDLGLALVLDDPRSSYRRMSRYDLTGLVWLLRGRSVVALTQTTATIQLGPLGDSLGDLR